jgi:hypothetical protein
MTAADSWQVVAAVACNVGSGLHNFLASSAFCFGSGQANSAEKRKNAKTALVEEASFAKGEAGVARSEPGDVMELPSVSPLATWPWCWALVRETV